VLCSCWTCTIGAPTKNHRHLPVGRPRSTDCVHVDPCMGCAYVTFKFVSALIHVWFRVGSVEPVSVSFCIYFHASLTAHTLTDLELVNCRVSHSFALTV